MPTAVDKLNSLEVVQIELAPVYAACTATDGSLWTWGENKFQQLGLNSKKETIKKPTQVTFPAGVRIVQVSCSKGEKHSHTHALTADGDVYSWGDQYKGQLGILPDGVEWGHDLKDNLVGTPTKVNLVHQGREIKAQKVLAAGIHTAILSTEGVLYTFGCGSDGRLGHPEYEGSNYLYKESHPK